MLDIKYRPRRFSDVIGQKGPISVLKARIRREEAFSTSYLFSGHPGTGKTTLARIFVTSLFCRNHDPGSLDPCLECDNCEAIASETFVGFTEKDAATQGTIEVIRGILDDLPYQIPGVPCRVVLLDECHRLSLAAQDALLKSVEEKKIVLILCTTEPEKVRGPIRTRCEDHVFRKPSLEDVQARVEFILEQEGVEYDPEAVSLVVKQGGGLVRETLNRIETLSQIGAITVESVRDLLGIEDASVYYRVLQSGPEQALTLLDSLLSSHPPHLVCDNLAQVALCCYRAGMGVPSTSSLYDKDLGGATFEKVGAATLLQSAKVLASLDPTPQALLAEVALLKTPRVQPSGFQHAEPSKPTLPPVSAPLSVQTRKSPKRRNSKASKVQKLQEEREQERQVFDAMQEYGATPVQPAEPSQRVEESKSGTMTLAQWVERVRAVQRGALWRDGTFYL